MKRLFLILTLLLFASTANSQITVTEGPVARPLPQAIQSMNDEKYAAWAIWHNLVTTRNTGKYTASKWLYGTTIDIYNRSNGRMNTNSSLHRRSHSSVNSNHNSFVHRRSYQYRYYNSDYTGSGSITIYNPFARHEGNLGYPDYENIYLPTPKGPQSMADLILSPPKKIGKTDGITSDDAVKLIEKYGSSWYDHVEEIGL